MTSRINWSEEIPDQSLHFDTQWLTKLVVDRIEDIKHGSVTAEVLATMFDLLPVQLLLKDPEGRYLYLNRGAKLGLIPDNSITPVLSDTHATPIPHQQQLWRQKEIECMEGKCVTEDNVHWTDLSGRTRVNQVVNVPVVDAMEHVLGVAVVAHDITHRAQTQASVHLLHLLQHDWVNGLLGTLVSNIGSQRVRSA